MSREFYIARIDAIQAQIIAFEAALLAFASNGALQEYTIDTGQTVQTVKRANLAQLRNTITGLENQLATLEARMGCGGQTRMVPSW